MIAVAASGVLVALWAALLWWQRERIAAVWREPVLAHPLVAIESDDWGPGPDWHAERLEDLLRALAPLRDAAGTPPVVTAFLVMAVPDVEAMRSDGFRQYRRAPLARFPAMADAIRRAIADGGLAAALHGLEHLHGPAVARLLAAGDPRVAPLLDDPTGWEALDGALQAHYVDGSRLPTTPLPAAEREAAIAEAQSQFVELTGRPARVTAAPCYLWDDEVEALWACHGIEAVSTAGYRCPGRDAAGRYVQDRRLIRPGERSSAGQRYLVRNVFWEPADGRTLDECRRELRRALAERAPIVVYTHRYNFTGDEALHRQACDGLVSLLEEALGRAPGLCFVASDALADVLASPAPVPALTRAAAVALRLWHRHRKARWLALASGLVLPGVLLVAVARLLPGSAERPWPSPASAP